MGSKDFERDRPFRMMLDAADESVIKTLGFLSGSYSDGDNPVDAFFRGMGRLLCDLEAGELEQLRAIVRLAWTLDDRSAEANVRITDEGQLYAYTAIVPGG